MHEIVADIEGSVGIIRINRPALHNALTPRMMTEIEDQVRRLSELPRLSSLALHGIGDKAFSVGCDIGIIRGMTTDEIGAFMEVGGRCMAAIEACPKPVIALVNGYALGGGFELVLACDLAFAAEHASFGFPEVTLGIIPGFGGTQRLPRRVGNARAKDIIYTGRSIDATTALSWGIVNRVVPAEHLRSTLHEVVQSLEKSSPQVLAAAKRAIQGGNNEEYLGFLDCFEHPTVDDHLATFLKTHKSNHN